MQRKYGINTDSGLFGVKQVEGQDTFFAKVGNAAFVGHSPLVVELSLDSRVDLKELNGFNKVNPPIIASIITTAPNVPINITSGVGVYDGQNGIILHGGLSRSGSTNARLSKTLRYDIETDVWDYLKDGPLQRFLHSAVMHDGFMFVFWRYKTYA